MIDTEEKLREAEARIAELQKDVREYKEKRTVFESFDLYLNARYDWDEKRQLWISCYYSCLGEGKTREAAREDLKEAVHSLLRFGVHRTTR